MLSHYVLLKIDPFAGQDSVEQSYRNFLDEIRRYGPGIEFNESEIDERFPEIAQAYNVLRDPEKRKIYDKTLFSQTLREPKSTVAHFETEKLPLANRLSNYLLALVFLVSLLYALSHFFAL
jgi:DnaJ-class molecular chaperone